MVCGKTSLLGSIMRNKSQQVNFEIQLGVVVTLLEFYITYDDNQ